MFPGYIGLLLLMLLLIPGLPGVPVRPSRPIWPAVLAAVRRREWLLFSLSVVLLAMANWSSQHFLGIHIKDLGADESVVGTVAAVAALAELPVLFLGAPLIARFGLRRMLLTAYTMTALRLVLYAVMPAAAWAIPIALLHSVTFGVYWVAGVAYVHALAPDDLKATSQGLLYAAMGIAGVLAGPLSGYVFDALGANRLFLISALVALTAGLILRLALPAGSITPARR
jgi:PPP family 3-phenylpropionic acid transporter